MPKQILVVDDDRLTRRSLELHLQAAGYQAASVCTVAQALAAAEEQPPDLILLDIGLPDIDGLDGLRIFRARLPNVPVIFVTGRRRELDEIIGLEMGADDYITKPFDVDVLLAHIKAVLRRSSSAGEPVFDNTLVVGDLTVDPAAHEVQVSGQRVELTPKEFDVLLYLARNAGRVVSVADILREVWGSEWIGEDQTIYVHIRWLRTKIERDAAKPERLVTVRGAGYKLVSLPELV